uniref:Transmembrane protein 8B n=1 Tax=Eptatretus burgeri TaxID=7764 RepID=A0A8C4R273_EPTBU
RPDVCGGFVVSLRKDKDEEAMVEFYTQGPQKLSFFHFYTSVQLFHFQLPQDTTLALWSLVAFKERGSGLGEACPDHPISVYLRPGAPPVINPLQTDFPPYTLVPGVISLRLEWNSPNKTNSSFNVSNPLPGDCNSSVNPELCVPFRPTLRNDLDTLSTQFYIFFGPNVTVRAKVPTILALTLIPHMDSGAVFTFEMQLNVLHHPFWCFIPFPFFMPHFMCLLCRQLTHCSNYSAQVLLHAYLSPCIADCGIYGECRLMRSYSYVLAACRCRAGWNGWGCTDGTKALSYAQQLLRTMLLTLSNLMFVPPIVIALRSCLYMESAVYAFNMFFSTFYHACDQPGVAVLCIMDYDVLQYCDFFGSLMSVWVTLIAMARLKNTTKEIMYLLGALVLAMVVQLDRWGLWNLLGPCLFALILMSRRHSCYPPSWRRWVFFLLPGCSIAITAVLLYALVETTANYYYTHALWHILIAGSVSFLLPPHDARSINIHGAAGRKRCGYQLCQKTILYCIT